MRPNCYIEGERGSCAFFSGYGKSATAAILRDRAPAFLGMSMGSAYIPGRYVSLVGSCMFHVLLCHLAEVIHAGAEIASWPTWCFCVLNNAHKNKKFKRKVLDLKRQNFPLRSKSVPFDFHLQCFCKQPNLLLHYQFVDARELVERVSWVMGTCTNYKAIEKLFQ